MRLLTEDYPPFSFREATGALTGQSVEIEQALFRRMEVSAPIEVCCKEGNQNLGFLLCPGS